MGAVTHLAGDVRCPLIALFFVEGTAVGCGQFDRMSMAATFSTDSAASAHETEGTSGLDGVQSLCVFEAFNEVVAFSLFFAVCLIVGFFDL